MVNHSSLMNRYFCGPQILPFSAFHSHPNSCFCTYQKPQKDLHTPTCLWKSARSVGCVGHSLKITSESADLTKLWIQEGKFEACENIRRWYKWQLLSLAIDDSKTWPTMDQGRCADLPSKSYSEWGDERFRWILCMCMNDFKGGGNVDG